MQQQTAVRAPRSALPLPKFIHPDDMPDLYAMTGVGSCMSPLVEDGACCVFDKREEPLPGDLVGLIFTPEAAARRRMPGWIKRLVLGLPPHGLGSGASIVVEQVNPPREFWIDATDVLAVHKFVGTAISQPNGMALFARKQPETV